MKNFLIALFLFTSLSLFSQSLETRCRVLNRETYEDMFTNCYVNFDTAKNNLKVTYPNARTYYLKEVSSLSSGNLQFIATGSDGNKYTIRFFDASTLAGGNLLTLEIDPIPDKKEEFRYIYFLNGEIVIPILNKYLEKF